MEIKNLLDFDTHLNDITFPNDMSNYSYNLQQICKADLSNLSHYQKVITLKFYSELVNIIDELGWDEHTSDWDLFSIITLNNNDEILTCAGYPYIILPDLTTCVDYDQIKEISYYLNEEEKLIKIDIENIKSIKLQD